MITTWLGSLSLLQGIFPTQGSNPGLPHYRQILYQLSHKGSPRILEWVAYHFSSWSSWPRKLTWASCIADRFFTNFSGGWDSKAPACNAGDPGEGIGYLLQYSWTSLVVQMVKNPQDLGSIPGLGRSPGGGHGNPSQYSCLENPHGQRSLAVSWDRKESDITKRLRTTQCMILICWLNYSYFPNALPAW